MALQFSDETQFLDASKKVLPEIAEESAGSGTLMGLQATEVTVMHLARGNESNTLT